MKEFLENYKQHRDDIEFFLQESIRNIGDLSSCKKDNFKELSKIIIWHFQLHILVVQQEITVLQ